MKVRILGRRVLVFQLINRRRLESGLYVGNPLRGNYSRTEEIWPITQGPECRGSFTPGTKHFVHDGFELDPTDLDLWEDLKDDPAFSGLAKLRQETDGDIETRVVSEISILAVEDDGIV